jgi:hypothetical protein
MYNHGGSATEKQKGRLSLPPRGVYVVSQLLQKHDRVTDLPAPNFGIGNTTATNEW